MDLDAAQLGQSLFDKCMHDPWPIVLPKYNLK